MKTRPIHSLVCVLCLGLCIPVAALAQVNVTTWHNDGARDGANTDETVLTPANVSASGSFGEKFSVTVDGTVTAQPLYMSGLQINGGTHNVVFVATEHDSVYAIDANNGAILWKTSFLGSGMTSVPSTLENCLDITPEIGITGTPVIDPSTDTLYVVDATMPGPVQQLHALDILNGEDKFGGPVPISASVPGMGAGSTDGIVPFNPTAQNQRSGLLLTNGHIVIAWGSHCDHDTFHGWLMSYNATTLAQETVFTSTPDGSDGGIWMAGAAPAVDANGNIFLGTGNGDFVNYTSNEYGDSILRMPQPVAGQAWEPVDGFTPWDQDFFDVHNQDMGDGGVVLLPNLPTAAQHQQLAIEEAKDDEIMVVDRNDLGHYCTTCSTNGVDTNIVQELHGQLRGDTSGTPAFWNGNLYFGNSSDPLETFSFNTTTGALSSTPVQQGAYVFGSDAPTPSVSSNGNADGIVWALDADNPSGEALLAYDATDLSNLLYQATINSPGPHFEVPTIANGMVYVGSQSTLTAFGLLSSQPVLTITASNVSVPQGQAIPALTGYTATGFVNGDNSSILSGTPNETTTAKQGSPAGTYPIDITQGSLTANSSNNYTFQFVNGTLTVTGGQSQTITFNALPNVTYGVGAITLAATASSGLPVSFAVTGPASVSGSTLNITGAGTVTVTASQSGNSSYGPATPISRSFTVSPAALTITAANVTVPYNQPIPALTGYTPSGFVHGDTSAVLSGTPAESTTATQGSPAGTYPISITKSTLAAANYTFVFANGTLTISQTVTTPPVTLTFSENPVAANTPFSYTVVVGSGTAGQPNPVGTITVYGYLPNGQLVKADGPHPIGTAGSAGVSTLSSTISPGVPAGQYRVYVTFTPASGSTYTTTNSPQITVTAK
ncbi:MAG: MBG domain-containing protein [Acidobacteriaceae bacterium]